MRQLTQEEAERCARALRWEWVERFGWIEIETDYALGNVPLDPYFWFGRLWDTLDLDERGLAMFTDSITPYETAWCISGVYAVGDGVPRLKSPMAMSDHPCLALCEAIEKLTCQVTEQDNQEPK